MRYVIVPTEEVTQCMFNHAVQNELEDLRKSLDGTNAVLKYNGDKPDCLTTYTDYSHEDILNILSASAWLDLSSWLNK